MGHYCLKYQPVSVSVSACVNGKTTQRTATTNKIANFIFADFFKNFLSLSGTKLERILKFQIRFNQFILALFNLLD